VKVSAKEEISQAFSSKPEGTNESSLFLLFLWLCQLWESPLLGIIMGLDVVVTLHFKEL
jgi:hypothetical protein